MNRLGGFPLCFIMLSLVVPAFMFGQASSFFPNQIGFQWKYDVVYTGEGDTDIAGSQHDEFKEISSHDTTDGLSAYTIDSRLLEAGPSIVTAKFYFDGDIVTAYPPSLPPPLDTIVSLPEELLTLFKFQGGVVVPWTIIEWETTIEVDSVSIPVKIKVTGSRPSFNSSVTVPAGDFVTARFNIKSEVGTQVGPVFIPFLTLVDTFWVAPELWVIKHKRDAVTFNLNDTIGLTISGIREQLISTSEPDGVFEDLTLPSKIELFQNYPNPFNPATEIQYRIFEAGFVELTIYNTIGQVVGTPIKEWKSPGEYSINFDATGLPSGVYHYELSSGRTNQRKQMVLIR